jgi:hypothetical protein
VHALWKCQHALPFPRSMHGFSLFLSFLLLPLSPYYFITFASFIIIVLTLHCIARNNRITSRGQEYCSKKSPHTVCTGFFNNRKLYRNRMYVRYGLVFRDNHILYIIYTVCYFDRISYVTLLGRNAVYRIPDTVFCTRVP